MGFTLVGAAVLTLTRTRNQRVPQEALIGIVYVVAAAASIVVLSKSAGGKEELQRSLVGELLVVPPAEVTKTFGLYVILGVVHFLFRKKFFAISAGLKARLRAESTLLGGTFVFYMLFGLVVTSFVHIGGVLLVFSYLVIPASLRRVPGGLLQIALLNRLGSRHSRQRRQPLRYSKDGPSYRRCHCLRFRGGFDPRNTRVLFRLSSAHFPLQRG
jgi:zinc/manganese transport system permease protein